MYLAEISIIAAPNMGFPLKKFAGMTAIKHRNLKHATFFIRNNIILLTVYCKNLIIEL